MIFAVVAAFARRLNATAEEGFDGLTRIALGRGHDTDAPLRQMANQSFAGAAGYQNLGAVQRMRLVRVETMKGHFGRKIEAFDFPGRGLTVGLKDDEAARPSGVAGDGAEVLTGNGDAHECSP